ncbi:unnamed protein product [Discosporangium mesarthrocarpum]
MAGHIAGRCALPGLRRGPTSVPVSLARTAVVWLSSSPLSGGQAVLGSLAQTHAVHAGCGSRGLSSHVWGNIDTSGVRLGKHVSKSPKPAETESEAIHAAGMAELDRVEKAVEGMTGMAGVFNVTRSENRQELWIDLGDTIGKYWVQYYKPMKMLCLASPRSGGYRYVFSAEQGKWVGELDGHDFEGMLTRDLIQQAYGCPKF